MTMKLLEITAADDAGRICLTAEPDQLGLLLHCALLAGLGLEGDPALEAETHAALKSLRPELIEALARLHGNAGNRTLARRWRDHLPTLTRETVQ